MDTAEDLRSAIHAFVRRFGLLEQSQTPCGVPLPISHAHALMELLHAPEMTQQALAEKLGLSKSNISRLVDRLVADERATRQKDSQDGRAYRITLTEKGRRLAEDIDARSLVRHGALLANLPEHERATVLRATLLLAEACHSAEGRTP